VVTGSAVLIRSVACHVASVAKIKDAVIAANVCVLKTVPIESAVLIRFVACHVEAVAKIGSSATLTASACPTLLVDASPTGV